MKIVADENIPWVSHYFGRENDFLFKPGRSITRHDLLDADILLVRSVTRVDLALLQDTPVRFVGSATAGYDHLDIAWLEARRIRWAIAHGCNADAVAEYVVSIVAALQRQGLLLKKPCRAGVIGVGKIGSRVVEKLQILGCEALQYDPIRAESEKDFISVDLNEWVDMDFVTLHTPLTLQGRYPTYHLIDQHFLKQQKRGCILLNTARGSVVHFADLKQYGKHLYWCLDAFENEPWIDREILQSALIATPHIAGYSIQSKYRGTEMLYQAALEQGFLSNKVPMKLQPRKTISFENQLIDWRDVILKIYDPMQTSQHMKAALAAQTETFDALRKNFSERYEFQYIMLEKYRLNEIDKNMIKRLGIRF